MKTLELERFAYTPTETQGRLLGIDGEWVTIERPWIKGPFLGGMSNESCVPDGEYELVPHTRPNGEETVALVNPDLGVWYQENDRPDDWGRFLILIHSGNWVTDVIGCIAPGVTRTIYNNRLMVTNSRAAMRQMNVRQYGAISIHSVEGAKD